MKSEANLNSLLHTLSQIIHCFQLERGSLCLYLCAPTDENLKRLELSVNNSDNQLNLLNKYLSCSSSKLNDKQLNSTQKLAHAIEAFHVKSSFRQEISMCDLDIAEVVPLYTYSLIIHLIYKLIELALFEESVVPSEVSALSNYINWKERIGRERALGVIGFTTGEFDSDVFLRDFKILLDEQEINKSSFLALASPSQSAMFNNMYSTQKDIKAFHQQMDTGDQPQLDAEFWFGVVSTKMDMMHGIELALIDQFSKQDKENIEPQNHHLFAVGDIQMVSEFPMFRNLSENIKQTLFKSSNLRNYKKGSLLFLEGEQATRIFVVVSGWVKIYKSALDGQESIEYMLTTGDVVIESSIFTSSIYNNSAQVSSEAKLLSFPAAIYRNLISKDLTLALNSLKYLSQSSAKYQSQIDSNRLKSSKERVGQFLLREFVKQKNPNTILLPYEKTIIASVLDMKPETFSRSLKSLKKEGLTSEKQQIQVKNIKTLCSFCDKEIAASCQFKDKHDCSFEKNTPRLSQNARDPLRSRP